jgi:hypothetical protein
VSALIEGKIWKGRFGREDLEGKLAKGYVDLKRETKVFDWRVAIKTPR